MLLQRTRRLLRLDERTAPIETFSLRAFTTGPLLHQWRRLRSQKAALRAQRRARASRSRGASKTGTSTACCKRLSASGSHGPRGPRTVLQGPVNPALAQVRRARRRDCIAYRRMSSSCCNGCTDGARYGRPERRACQWGTRATDRPYRREPPPCAHAGAGRRNRLSPPHCGRPARIKKGTGHPQTPRAFHPPCAQSPPRYRSNHAIVRCMASIWFSRFIKPWPSSA